ncbi:MAG: CvpA family protein [Defluviitaleaceae bacterium]|nr:CvpA family protein [Defluviitaleaceae bacterium]
MNPLDIVILAIVALCAIAGYHKGLIRTVYRLVSFIVAIILARQLYPHVARTLRQTALFPTIRDGIAHAMNLEGFVTEQTTMHTTNLIDNLPLPGVLQNMLHSHNTPSMFELLQVATLEEYVAGFFANMVINGLAILAVFALTMLALTFIGYALDIVSKLPVIRTLNRIGGFLFGVLISAVIIWVGLVLMALFVVAAHPMVSQMLEGSWITQRLFELTLPQLAMVV